MPFAIIILAATAGAIGGLYLAERGRLPLTDPQRTTHLFLADAPSRAIPGPSGPLTFPIPRRAGPTLHPSDDPDACSIPRFVLGMTSVSRSGHPGYVHAAVKSLVAALESSAAANSSAPPITLLLFNGDYPPSKHTAIAAIQADGNITASSAVTLRIIDTGGLHPQLRAALQPDGSHNLTDPIFHDPPERLWWRSKEALDTAFLMNTALQHIAKQQAAAPAVACRPPWWYLHFQDDIKVTPGFLDKLTTYINRIKALGQQADIITLFSSGDGGRQPREPYIVEINTGGQALVFNVSFVESFVPFLKQHFTMKPVDWLMGDYLKSVKGQFHVYLPNLVQHCGRISSLKNKIQPLTSATYVGPGC